MARVSSAPEDAFRCFMGTEMEGLAIGTCFLRKERQEPGLKQNYRDGFALD
jgi:carbamoyltransferase